jgi:tRNA threonylcarbamoyladenosine biosynthesis protein TsaE
VILEENQTFTFHTPLETQAWAEELARKLPAGTVIALVGDLGTGKTTFVQGFARGLGIPEHVGSPTFKLVSEYQGSRLTLYHVDCYRLHTPQDFVNIGGLELLSPGEAITVVEWADRIQDVLTPGTLQLQFHRFKGEPERRDITVYWL